METVSESPFGVAKRDENIVNAGINLLSLFQVFQNSFEGH